MNDKNQEESILTEESLLNEESLENDSEKLLSDETSLLEDDSSKNDEEKILSDDPLLDDNSLENFGEQQPGENLLTDNDVQNSQSEQQANISSTETDLLDELPPTDNPIEKINTEELLNEDQTISPLSAAPFDDALGGINASLNSLEKKIETEQDQISSIKDELIKINQNDSSADVSSIKELNLSENLELSKKIKNIETRLKNIDNTISKFNALEKELEIDYEEDELNNSNSSDLKIFANQNNETTDNEPLDERVVEQNKIENTKKDQNQRAKVLLLILLLIVLGFWALEFFGFFNFYLLDLFTIKG